MQMPDEIHRGRLRQLVLSGLLVDLSLDAHMSGGLDLQMPALLVFVEVALKGALDIAGMGAMPLDKVAIVSVHDADEIGQVRCGLGMQRLAKSCGGSREFRDHVGALNSEKRAAA